MTRTTTPAAWTLMLVALMPACREDQSLTQQLAAAEDALNTGHCEQALELASTVCEAASRPEGDSKVHVDASFCRVRALLALGRAKQAVLEYIDLAEANPRLVPEPWDARLADALLVAGQYDDLIGLVAWTVSCGRSTKERWRMILGLDADRAAHRLLKTWAWASPPEVYGDASQAYRDGR